MKEYMAAAHACKDDSSATAGKAVAGVADRITAFGTPIIMWIIKGGKSTLGLDV